MKTKNSERKVFIMKTMEQFRSELIANKELAEKLIKTTNEQELEAFLKENEVDCTNEQFKEFMRAKERNELTDEELKAVSGGAGGTKCGQPVNPRIAIRYDSKNRPIEWRTLDRITKEPIDEYHFECPKCKGWMYEDSFIFYTSNCEKCDDWYFFTRSEYKVITKKFK